MRIVRPIWPTAAPAVVAWVGADQVMPLRELDAWRVYVDGPVALADLLADLSLGDAPVGLLGTGAGAEAAFRAAAGAAVRAVAVVDPVVGHEIVAGLHRVPRGWSSLVVVTGEIRADALWYALSLGDPAGAALVSLPHAGPTAARVDEAVTDWFRRTLDVGRGR
jgi:hypothetical protein